MMTICLRNAGAARDPRLVTVRLVPYDGMFMPQDLDIIAKHVDTHSQIMTSQCHPNPHPRSCAAVSIFRILLNHLHPVGATALLLPPNGIAHIPLHLAASLPMKSSMPIRLRPRRSSPAAAESLSPSSSSTPSPSLSPSPALRCPKFSTCYSTALLPASVDTRAFLDSVCTPSSLLWDPRYTSKQHPSFTPPLRTSSSPAVRRTPVIVQDDLDTEDNIDEMDKRHPSSFQQLEKLGEGTYATVRPRYFCSFHSRITDGGRSSKGGTARPASW